MEQDNYEINIKGCGDECPLYKDQWCRLNPHVIILYKRGDKFPSWCPLLDADVAAINIQIWRDDS